MTPLDALDAPAGRDVVIDELIDLGQLVRILVLAADRYRAAASQALGLHLTEMTALGHIWHAGQLTPRDLSTRLRITTPAVTALLDRLEQRDMVRRQPNPADRRSLLVTLTPTAVAAYNGTVAELSEVTSAGLLGLTDAQIEAVRHFLRNVSSSFLIRGNAPARDVA